MLCPTSLDVLHNGVVTIRSWNMAAVEDQEVSDVGRFCIVHTHSNLFWENVSHKFDKFYVFSSQYILNEKENSIRDIYKCVPKYKLWLFDL